jgi:hypothetical protein
VQIDENHVEKLLSSYQRAIISNLILNKGNTASKDFKFKQLAKRGYAIFKVSNRPEHLPRVGSPVARTNKLILVANKDSNPIRVFSSEYLYCLLKFMLLALSY